MRNIPMVNFPKASAPKLSKAMEVHKDFRGTYAKYAPVKRVACHECVNVLHEARGVGEPPLSARHARNFPAGRLLLCTPHKDLWEAIDGAGKKR